MRHTSARKTNCTGVHGGDSVAHHSPAAVHALYRAGGPTDQKRVRRGRSQDERAKRPRHRQLGWNKACRQPELATAVWLAQSCCFHHSFPNQPHPTRVLLLPPSGS